MGGLGQTLDFLMMDLIRYGYVGPQETQSWKIVLGMLNKASPNEIGDALFYEVMFSQ